MNKTAGSKGNRGVKGRAVKWKGETWIVAHVDARGDLHLRRETPARILFVGAIPRSSVKFVWHSYEAKP